MAYVYQIDGDPLCIKSFENVYGNISINSESKEYSLQSLMNTLYALSESIIISNEEPNDPPPAGKGFWLDTSVSSNTTSSDTDEQEAASY